MKTSGGRRRQTQAVSPARRVACDVLLDWGRDRGYAADLIEHACRNEELSGADHAFLRDMVLTTLRNLGCLDRWINGLTSGRHLDDRTKWVLRLGLCQLLILGVAEHAAVNETVSLAWKSGGLVNAVLRRSCREKDALLSDRDSWPVGKQTSHPSFLVERWERDLGPEMTAAVCRLNQEPPPVHLRVNRLKIGALDRVNTLPGLAWRDESFFQCDALPLEELAEGLVYVQDPSTAMAPVMLAPQPGERIMDACAAPGGKAALMAELMQNQGEIVAADGASARMPRLRENLKRLGVDIADVQLHRWGQDEIPSEWRGSFDRVLVDVPCSNTGVMRRRVDVRWRLEPEDFSELAEQQFVIAKATIPCLKLGGVMVYSTCSIDREENEGVVEQLLAADSRLVCLEMKTLLPPRDGMDGAFAALLKKEASA